MEQVGGMFAGRDIWVSSFNNGEYFDKQITLDNIQICGQDYITSEIEGVKGKSKKEVALAYYAFSQQNAVRNSQKRIFEIICGLDSVDIYVFDGFGHKNVNEILHQSEKIEIEDSERFITAKAVVEMLVGLFPLNEEIVVFSEQVKEYEYLLLSGEEEGKNSEINNLIDKIYSQINFVDEIAVVELFDCSFELTKQQYLNEIVELIAEIYLPLIQKLLERVNNNFEKNDIVYLYIRNISEHVGLRTEIEKIAKNNCIVIEVDNYSDRYIARGNAYLYYLRNYLLQNKIKENIDRFYVLFEKQQVNLGREKDRILFRSKSDFGDCYAFAIIDKESMRSIEVDLDVPFAISNTQLQFSYAYESEGLEIEISDIKTGEKVKTTLKYTY